MYHQFVLFGNEMTVSRLILLHCCSDSPHFPESIVTSNSNNINNAKNNYLKHPVAAVHHNMLTVKQTFTTCIVFLVNATSFNSVSFLETI